MYAIHKQIHPPTGVELCCFANLISPTEKNLITAGVNQLIVYRLAHGSEACSDESSKTILEQLASFSLFGNIASIQPVQLHGSSRSALLLTFQNAKLSLVEYDPYTADLRTLSLHHFEENDHYIPILRADPESRCAVMLIYGKRLVVLPLRQDFQKVTDDLDSSFEVKGGNHNYSTYIIELRNLDEKICNVVDIQFLHGYHDPTVFILYEPLPTWSGRVPVRKDTCSIVAISLNIQEKVHPIIWSMNNLPYDCRTVYPVPKPIGGVLVFGINCLLFLNQSVPPHGVSLNSLTTSSTEFNLKIQDGVQMCLDRANACFVENDKLVLSLRNGELYVLTLIVDGMRSVQRFVLDKAAASVLTTCMCSCGPEHLFLGSRLGNSLLLRHSKKTIVDAAAAADNMESDGQPPAKKSRPPEVFGGACAGGEDDALDMDVYGSGNDWLRSGPREVTTLAFEVCDSVTNLAPISQMVLAEPAFASDEFSEHIDPDLEIVCVTGHGKNGSISVVQRTIKPQIVTTFELPGIQDMWTLKSPSSHNASGDEESGHAYLLLSREDSSLILETGSEIMELDTTGFITSTPTILAANFMEFSLQVCHNTVTLLKGVEQVHSLVVEGPPLVAACAVAPYALATTALGGLVLVEMKRKSGGDEAQLELSRPDSALDASCKTIAVALFQDEHGLFKSESVTDEASNVNNVAAEVAKPTQLPAIPTPVNFGKTTSVTSEPVSAPVTKRSQSPVKQSSYWALLAKDNGDLMILQVPEFKEVFHVSKFSLCHKVLVDSHSDPSKTQQLYIQDMPVVKEISMVAMGNRGTRPHLFARMDEEVVVYEPFSCPVDNSEGRLHVRFRKLDLGLILRERVDAKLRRTRKLDPDADPSPFSNMAWIRPFKDVSGYSGVFLCGPYPHWLMMTSRGAMRVHPMSIDGAVMSFACFHNVNCPKGFLYFNRQSELRIAVLPTHVLYDTIWPLRKIPMRQTVHYAIYHPESKTFSVCTSVQEINKQTIKVHGDGEKEFEQQERDERFIWPTVEKFSVQLHALSQMDPVPNTKLEMENFEQILCMKFVSLRSEETVTGYKGYIAIGTTHTFCEEVGSRGRVILYDVIEVVPEPGKPLTKHKMKVEYDKEQKGPVTALDTVNGFLITAQGQKIYIWQLKAGDLMGVAFMDTQIYTHSMSVCKNLILAGDFQKSISVLRYQTERRVLSVVSRDIRPQQCYAVNFVVDDKSLCFLTFDHERNLLIFTYQPESRESCGGMALSRRADFHVGMHVNACFRIRGKMFEPSIGPKPSGHYDNRHVNIFASLDGAFGFLLPVPEKVYRRLLMVQNALNSQLPHTAGLNPKAFRAVKHETRGLLNPQRNVLDGDLVWAFLDLSHQDRFELARRIGTSIDQILDDIMDIDRLTAHF